MCINNAYYDQINAFQYKPSHIAFRLRREDRQMPPEVYYQKVSKYSQENTCVEVGLQPETPKQIISCKY